MGARTFTDDEGNKFELATSCWDDHSGELHIKPIKAVEKKTYCIDFSYAKAIDSYHSVWDKELDMTEPTAQKVAAAVETLMAYIQRPYPINPEYDETDAKFVEADDARKAFQEEV